LHLPGELFVEYQLAAKARRPDLFVALAAYGDFSPGYIGTAIAYEQGGYVKLPRLLRTWIQARKLNFYAQYTNC
jgi:hypothetical protein